MATLPAYTPEIPYLGLIPGGLRHGSMVRINGTIPYGGNRFSIHFQTGAATRPRDDTALHMSVRPTDPVIVRNHLENKNWGTEERFGGCPIYPGQPFEILVLAEATAYKIAINGTHFCHFTHRISMHRVTFIAVDGDVTITSIRLDSDTPSAPPMPPPMPTVPIKPYPPSYIPGHPGHRPHYPPHHFPHRPHYPGHHGPPHHGPPHLHPPHHAGVSHLPGYVPTPPPPPYSPGPVNYIQAREEAAPPYSLENDQAYLKRKKRNKALKYAAAAAGVGGGVGLTAFALSRAFGGGGGDDGDDGGDYDDGGDE